MLVAGGLYFKKSCSRARFLQRRWNSSANDVKALVESLMLSSKFKYEKTHLTRPVRRNIPLIPNYRPLKFKEGDRKQALVTSKVIWDNNDSKDFGKLFISHFILRHLNRTRAFVTYQDGLKIANSFIESISKAFKSWNLRNDELGVLQFLGLYALSDRQSCERFVTSFIDEDITTEEVVSIEQCLDCYSPRLQGDKIDLDIVQSERSSPLELPIIKKIANLNPIYLIDTKKLEEFHDYIEGEYQEDTLRSKLNDLENFGKLSFEFNFLLAMFKLHKKSDTLFLEVHERLDVNISNLLRFSLFDRIIPEYDLIKKLPKESIRKVFYRYVALLDLEGDSLEPWLEHVTSHLLQHTDLFSSNFSAWKSNDIMFIGPKVPNIILPTALTDKILPSGDLSGEMEFQVEKLGKDHLLSVIQGAIMTNGIPTDEEKGIRIYYKTVLNHVDANINKQAVVDTSFGRIKCSCLTYMGLFALADREQCSTFILSFWENGPTKLDLNYLMEQTKYLVYEKGVPSLGINQDVTQQPKSALALPALSNKSLYTRFILVNCSIISGQDRGRDKNKKNRWLYDEDIKQCLHSWCELGATRYRLLVRYHLMKKLNSENIELIPDLMRLLTSNQFYNFLLSSANTFDLIENRKYKSLLIKRRFNNTLLHSQFSQYVSILYLNGQLEKWVERLTLLFSDLVNDLNYLDSKDLIHCFREEFGKLELSLTSLLKEQRYKKLKDQHTDLPLPEIQDVKYSLNSALAIKVSQLYLKFAIDLLILNHGLDSFIKSKMEMFDIISFYLKQNDNQVQKLSNVANTFEYLGYWLVDQNTIERKQLMTSLLNHALDKPLIPFDTKRVPMLDMVLKNTPRNNLHSFFIWDSSEIMLPIVNHSDSLAKLLSVNYFISRSFMSQLKNTGGEKINRLSDICTKFNSVGADYYKFAVYSKTLSLNLGPNIAEKLTLLLLDKKFESIVVHCSLILNPFSSSKYSQLISEHNKNSYLFMKFNHQSFSQYLGYLAFRDANVIDQWIDMIFSKLSLRMKDKPSHQQETVLAQFSDEVDHYFKDIMPRKLGSTR
ncbi:uncharacterized protein PRCAT00000671001 [Priceomyces carsonii]|uniref:uncharacterized protein n=1 Tax=Priceomyces carsonii TaxID=28549 RepID=UPI002ED85FE3|nr:unnamed protein product [Priceomyces carsonii]